MTQTSLSTFLLAGPELILVVTALVAYLGGAFCGLRQGWLVALIGIALAARTHRFERAIGLDRALLWHRWMGETAALLLAAHIITTLIN